MSDYIIYYYFEIYYNFTFGNPVLVLRALLVHLLVVLPLWGYHGRVLSWVERKHPNTTATTTTTTITTTTITTSYILASRGGGNTKTEPGRLPDSGNPNHIHFNPPVCFFSLSFINFEYPKLSIKTKDLK